MQAARAEHKPEIAVARAEQVVTPVKAVKDKSQPGSWDETDEYAVGTARAAAAHAAL